jgi:prepilin signal peptidase PulO-like enzyme (type II secretory pathway)
MKDFIKDLPALVLVLCMIWAIILFITDPVLRALPDTKTIVPIWLGLVFWLSFYEDIGKYINVGCDKERQPIRCDAP